jgi:D-inositol-3-phosphate glycosyltransferase
MISFVWTPSSFWTPPFPLIEGNGGSESFTLGQSRELTRRGIANQVITFGLGKKDGRHSAPDVTYVDFPTPRQIQRLEGDVVLATEPAIIKTAQPPFVMMHCPPLVDRTQRFYKKAYAGRRLISNSRYMARHWADYLGVDASSIATVYPFAAEVFGTQPAPVRKPGKTRVLFAGRLSVEKGFYTFLEATHFLSTYKDIEFTVVLAGKQGYEFATIEKLVRAHPMLRAIPARPRPKSMAELLVSQDIVVMPSHKDLWPEPFGMLSVEAQHAGCRVVASDVGGLPETDCGGLHLFTPGNPLALAETIRAAARRGRLTGAQRQNAARKFTVAQSVDQLLAVLGGGSPVYQPA